MTTADSPTGQATAGSHPGGILAEIDVTAVADRAG